MHRRTLLRALALAPLAATGNAFGQAAWPDRVVRIIVPFAAGSFTDVSARLLAVELTEKLGQSVIVDNRGGAGGTAGTTAVVRAEAGRAYAPAYRYLARDLARPLSEFALRSGARPGADQPHRRLPSILLVRPGTRPAHPRRPRGAREAEAGRPDLRLGRARLLRTSRHGAPVEHRRRARGCMCRSAASRRRSPR